MKIKLPIQNKEIKEGKLVINNSEKDFDLDTTLAAQIRFETKFPNMAHVEDLFEYSKRICAIEETNGAIIISKMKMLYCWLDTDIDFIDFLKLFDLADVKYTQKLTKALQEAFNLVFNSSAEKN